MSSIFEFSSYKAYVRSKVHSLPNRGRGEWLRIAKLLRVHTSMVTHIFKGSANLSVEQGLEFANHFGLSSIETEFLITLIQMERSGTKRSRDYFQFRLDKLLERSQSLSERLKVQKGLSEEDRAIFYSNWYYMAIHILTSIEDFQNPLAIAERLKLKMEVVVSALQFLVETGLCVRDGDKYRVGVTKTYLERESPLISRHHSNWRLRVLEQIDRSESEDLLFTCPTSVSRADFKKIRESIVQLIQEFDATIGPSKDEEFACLNIDWVKIRP